MSLGTLGMVSGEYEISLRTDAQTVIATETITVDSDIVYDASNPTTETS